MKVSLFRHTADPTLTIDTVASICYDATPSNEGMIMKGCYESGHTSELEFVDFIFYVEGVSRSLLAQLTRHRHASFSVRSQRYCKEYGFDIVTPSSIENNSYMSEKYEETKGNIGDFYSNALANNIPPEDARMMLPNACHTNLYVKMNLRSLINFMNLRLCNRAQWEIRNLTTKMKDLAVEVMPEAEYMFVPKCEVNSKYPFCSEKKSCGRHPKLEEVYGR